MANLITVIFNVILLCVRCYTQLLLLLILGIDFCSPRSTENYRLQSKYDNNLVAKVALFQFVNSFLSLFYIAFYVRDQEKLKEQLAGLLISRQIIGNLRESVFPYFMEQLKLAKMSFVMWGALSPTQETTHSFDTDTKVSEEIHQLRRRAHI